MCVTRGLTCVMQALDPLLEVVNKTEIPIDQILPCHINRDQRLVTAGIDWVRFTCAGLYGEKGRGQWQRRRTPQKGAVYYVS